MTEATVSEGRDRDFEALGVAVAQFAPGQDAAANLATIRALSSTAAARGAHLVVFPEYSSYFETPMSAGMRANAEPLDGPFVSALSEIARECGLYLVVGMLEDVGDPERFSNTVVAIDAAGAVVAQYRKQHLYDAFGQRESDWVVPGTIEMPEIFDVGGFRVGMQTCYDIRFPELSRRLVNAGAELLLVPAEWVRGPLKEHHWRTLATARALENTVYLAAADHAPPVGVGNSLIVDPMGVELATIGDNIDVAIAWITHERLEAVREINPALLLRRYGVVPLA